MVAYAGAAWVVLQVLATLHDLGWLPTVLVNGAIALLLTGFPVVVGTAWVRLSGRGDADAPSRLVRLLTWRNALLGALGALALWGIAVTAWLVNRERPGAGADGEGDVQVLAVLPFDNLLPDAEGQQWLVEGLHEQVIHEIQQLGLPRLRVISRTSVLPYAGSGLPLPEIAERLGADAILEGSVRSEGTRLRAVMQLIDASTDHHRWSHEFDADLEESFLEAQTRVAARVAEAFTDAPGAGAIRDPDVPTAHPGALRAYLRGRHLWRNTGGPGGERARAFFREAVELDPGFALAWASLAETWLTSAHLGEAPHVAFPRADSAAVQAITRDPDLAEGRIVLADARFHYDWNWAEAERGFRAGIELNPSHATGHWYFGGLLGALGRTDEAVVQLERARTLEPMIAIIDAFGGRVLYWGRRYDAAEASVRQALELGPDNFYALGTLGFVHLARGEVAAAIDAFEGSTALSPKFLPGLALALARAGRTDEAREIVADLEGAAAEGYLAPYERAFAYVGLGDHARALDLIEEATRTRDAELVWIAVEPAFDPLRDEPRFRAVLEQMGLRDPGAPAAR